MRRELSWSWTTYEESVHDQAADWVGVTPNAAKSSAHASSLGSLPPDWCTLLSLLNSHRVRFLLAGAHALAVHGVPRATADLDLLVEPTAANAVRLARAIHDFGQPRKRDENTERQGIGLVRACDTERYPSGRLSLYDA